MYSKIIDIHAHFNHGSPYDCPQDIPYVICNRELDLLKKAYDDIGICAAGICTYASAICSDCAYEENHYLSNLVKKTDWMYQWVVIDPWIPKTYDQAEKLLQEKKTLGIKIHPDCHGYNIEDYAEELFALAAKHETFLLMHPQKIEKMTLWADRYPKMRHIIARLGTVDHVNAIADAKYGNIYVDTSGEQAI